MKSETIKLDNVTCKGFVKKLSGMLSKVEGISDVEIDHSNSELILTMKSAIPREDLIKQLIASDPVKSGTSTDPGSVKSCGNCVIEKLKLIP